MRYIIGICDNEIYQIELIRGYLDAYETKDEFIIFDEIDPHSFYEKVKMQKPHIVFLDVHMEKMNGIDLGVKIRRLSEDIIIVYISAFEKHAIEAFQPRAFRYLLKPVTNYKINELMLEITKYIKEIKKKAIHKTLIVKTNREIVCVNCDEILYFEKTGHKIRICSISGEIFYYDNFISLLKEIDKDTFVRCHQGYIVNINKVKCYRNSKIFIDDNQYLPVSRPYIDSVKRALGNRLFKERKSYV